jgi:hypothetical protein
MMIRCSWLLLGGFGCGHTHPEQPPVAQPSAAPRPSFAVAPAHDAGAPHVEATLPERKTAEATEPDSIANFMPQHFLIVAWARDAVVDGDLEDLREPLQALADYNYASVVPGGWMRGVAELQAAARLTATAENLTVAASGVAAMTRVCGECHEQQGHRLALFPEEVATKTPKSDEFSTRMHRHAWGSERLWEGLMAPSDQAWQAGAAALAHAPVKAPKLPAGAPKEFAASLTKLRDLGLRATQATSADERSNLYALTLAMCADCHSQAAIAGL